MTMPRTEIKSQLLKELVDSISYKPGWQFFLKPHPVEHIDVFYVHSWTDDSMNHDKPISVRHEFFVPPATYNRDTWAAWLFDRVRDVETHEAAEFFKIDGYREFAPHHSNGEDPYRVWHVGDHATAKKRSGDA